MVLLHQALACLGRATRLLCTRLLGCTKAHQNISRSDDRRHPNTLIGFTIIGTKGLLEPPQPRHRTAPTERPRSSGMELRKHTRSEDYLTLRQNKRESREECLVIPYHDRTANHNPLRVFRLRERWIWADRCRARTSCAGKRSITQNARVGRLSTKIRDTCQSVSARRGRWR